MAQFGRVVDHNQWHLQNLSLTVGHAQ